MKLLINEKREMLIRDSSKDAHTDFGTIKAEDIKSKRKVIKTHKGVPFSVVEPNFRDLFKRMKRGPQIIRLEDASFIASMLGLKEGQKALDIGGGSGAISCLFANIVGPKGRVVSIEKRKEFADIIRHNANLFGFKNIDVINLPIEAFNTKAKFDAINVDLPSPWEAISKIKELSRAGAMISVYSPNITQIARMKEEMKGFKDEGVYELLLRRWKVSERICHPEFKMLGHTGFIAFYRKIIT